MKRSTAALALIATALTLSACNTARGAKRDVHSASKAVEKATDGK